MWNCRCSSSSLLCVKGDTTLTSQNAREGGSDREKSSRITLLILLGCTSLQEGDEGGSRVQPRAHKKRKRPHSRSGSPWLPSIQTRLTCVLTTASRASGLPSPSSRFHQRAKGKKYNNTRIDRAHKNGPQPWRLSKAARGSDPPLYNNPHVTARPARFRPSPL